MNTKVTEVSAEKVFVEKNGKADTIEADKILVSVGRRPITKSLGLENLAIEIQGAGVKVNEHMLTFPSTCICGWRYYRFFPAGTYGLPGSGSCHTPYPRHTGRDEL